jgi:hypothetical protein
MAKLQLKVVTTNQIISKGGNKRWLVEKESLQTFDYSVEDT